MKDKRNLSLVMDFYELTMAQTYFDDHKEQEQVYFDIFYLTYSIVKIRMTGDIVYLQV